jgi:hypothetical protein
VQDAGAQDVAEQVDAPADAADLDAAPDASELPEAVCEAGAQRCVDRVVVETCAPDGSAFVPGRCPGDERCDEEAQRCLPILCVPGEVIECTSATTFSYCNPTGTRAVASPCPNNSPCTDGRCEQAACTPGQTRCVSQRSFEACSDDATGFGAPQDCPRGQECADNECQDLCTLNKKVSSYIGCEYWSLDLDNYDDALSQPHAIVVSNPNPELPARVTITRNDGVTPVPHDGPTELAPGQVGVYLMPTDSNISAVEVSDFAFKVTSNIPVTAHQFNPLNNVDVYSNDGSLLLPTNALGYEYLAFSWKQRPNPPLRGFVTVANPNEDTATVTVTTTSNTAPGPSIARMQQGETRDFVLGPGQVLNLSTLDERDDLTGTLIRANLPVAVFGGHECANVDLGIDRCDHIESQLFPTNTWGTTYLATKFAPRGPEPDVWRVMAAQDGTVVTLSFDFPNPSQQVHVGTLVGNEGGARFRLDQGEFVEFEIAQHFRLDATAPVGVAQYMVGSNWLGVPRICDQGIDAGNPTGIGDPALTLAVPTNQFRADYIILTPLDYDEDYINIAAPEGASITLDGQPIPAEVFEPLDGTGYLVAVVPVQDGPHTLLGDQPFGVQAYGYDCHVSYAYPGGLNLEAAR